MRPIRRPRAEGLGRGESELARAESDAGTVIGTRDALYLPTAADVVRLPWERVEAADWDQEAERLRVLEVGTWGQPRIEHALAVAEPNLLLQLVRERVSASVVLQRHVAISGAQGVRVIARRASSGRRAITWLFEYDAGIDPADPAVEKAAEAALTAAMADVGES